MSQLEQAFFLDAQDANMSEATASVTERIRIIGISWLVFCFYEAGPNGHQPICSSSLELALEVVVTWKRRRRVRQR